MSISTPTTTQTTFSFGVHVFFFTSLYISQKSLKQKRGKEQLPLIFGCFFRFQARSQKKDMCHYIDI